MDGYTYQPIGVFMSDKQTLPTANLLEKGEGTQPTKPMPTEAERILAHACQLATRAHDNKNIAIILGENHATFETLTPEIIDNIISARQEAVTAHLREIHSILNPSGDYKIPQYQHLPTLIYLLERIERLLRTGGGA